MEKEYFYVKPIDSIPHKLPEDLIYKISIDDINSLALFATTLEPVPSDTEINGYANALYTYIMNNNENNNYNDCYKKITSNSDGTQFLITTIWLFLLEKQMRNKCTDENVIKTYITTINDYYNKIEFNKIKNEENQQKKK